jgi:small subunit ribosomal protein S1
MERAAYKKNQAKIHKPFLDDFRLIKPLILKHPNLAKRWNTQLRDNFGNAPESVRNELDGNWIHGEERSAGFTYEDWANETDGATFKSWSVPQMGEIVSGVIAAYHKDGCFVEVGAKAWAFMPLKFLSLVPVNSALEAGLNIGDEVGVKVLSTIADSMLLRDWDCKFTVVSITEILREAAMQEVEAKQRGDEGTEPLFQVVVEFFRPFGAIVRTTSGLPGYIATPDLGDLAGNTQMLGQTITVEALSRFTNRENLANMNPMGPADFGLRFSYKNAATRELANTVEDGQVVDAVVSAILAIGIEVKVPVGKTGNANATVEVRKVDICSLPDWEIADYFEVGEEIKAYVISTEATTGEVRLSFRALDKPSGTVLTNKEKFNADADENAKVYFEKSTAQKEKLASDLAGLLDVGDDMDTKAKSGTIEMDMDDDDVF